MFAAFCVLLVYSVSFVSVSNRMWSIFGNWYVGRATIVRFSIGGKTWGNCCPHAKHKSLQMCVMTEDNKNIPDGNQPEPNASKNLRNSLPKHTHTQNVHKYIIISNMNEMKKEQNWFAFSQTTRSCIVTYSSAVQCIGVSRMTGAEAHCLARTMMIIFLSCCVCVSLLK